MAAADAMSFWISAVIPNDQFVVYCFGDPDVPLPLLAADLRVRAAEIDDLCLRMVEVPGDLDRPWWVAAVVDEQQVVEHPDVRDWDSCLARIAELMADQLDPTEHAWRLHLLGPMPDTPAGSGTAVTAVLQICHALGDGRRTAAIGRRVFGPDGPHGPGPVLPTSWAASIPVRLLRPALAARGAALLPLSLTGMVVRGMRAFRLSRSTPPRPESGVPATALNRPVAGTPKLGVLVLHRDQLPAGHTVTVGVLAALAEVLAEVLSAVVAGALPAAPSEENAVGGQRIAVELTVARTGRSAARNNFRNAGIDLHPQIVDPHARMSAIAAEIAAAQARAENRLELAERAASAATPSFLTRWGIKQFDATIAPATVTGVSVVSSVNRGPADLTLGAGKVLFTTGFPALSPAQGLTHGIHGIGDHVAISVTAAPGVLDVIDGVRDVDDYLARIARAVDGLGG